MTGQWGAMGPILAPDLQSPQVVPSSEPLLERLDHLIGVLEMHNERWEKSVTLRLASPSGLVAGNVFGYANGSPRINGFWAWTLFVDNPSGYILQEQTSLRLVPPTTYNYPVCLTTAQQDVSFAVYGGADTTAQTIIVVATEGRFLRW